MVKLQASEQVIWAILSVSRSKSRAFHPQRRSNEFLHSLMQRKHKKVFWIWRPPDWSLPVLLGFFTIASWVSRYLLLVSDGVALLWPTTSGSVQLRMRLVKKHWTCMYGLNFFDHAVLFDQQENDPQETFCFRGLVKVTVLFWAWGQQLLFSMATHLEWAFDKVLTLMWSKHFEPTVDLLSKPADLTGNVSWTLWGTKVQHATSNNSVRLPVLPQLPAWD